jgi:hypothetical protein
LNDAGLLLVAVNATLQEENTTDDIFADEVCA